MNNDADSAGKRFAGKTIPDFFGSLPSLEGLFLGEFMLNLLFSMSFIMVMIIMVKIM